MNTVEDRLREALAERARYSPVDPVNPDAWSRTMARSRRRRWRLRAGLLAPLAAAVAVTAIVIGTTSVVSPAPPGRPGAAPGRAMASPSPAGTPCDVLNMRSLCTSDVVNVGLGSAASATVTSVYFGYGMNRRTGHASQILGFCAMTRLQRPMLPNSPGPGGGGSCTGSSLGEGQVVSSADNILDVRWGLAASQVASVTAVLTDGRKVPGVVVSGRGFPHQAWLASYPKQDPATLLFSDAAGRQIGKLFVPAYDKDFTIPAASGIPLFTVKGGAVTAYLVNGLVTFRFPDTWDGAFPAAGWPAVTGLIGSGSYWAGNECFGYVHAGVTRVVIRLDNGYQREVSAFKPGWRGSGVRFFVTALPESLFPQSPESAQAAPQGTATAYDSAGHVLAEEPLISSP